MYSVRQQLIKYMMMKKNVVAIVLLSFAVLVSCDKESGTVSNEIDPITDVSPTSYLGKLEISSSTPYNQEEVKVSLFPNQKADSVNIVFYNVRFSSRMPVYLTEMTIERAALYSDGEKTIFTGDSIVPIAMGAPFLTYTVKDLNGKIDGDSIVMTMNIGSFPTKYAGVRR